MNLYGFCGFYCFKNRDNIIVRSQRGIHQGRARNDISEGVTMLDNINFSSDPASEAEYSTAPWATVNLPDDAPIWENKYKKKKGKKGKKHKKKGRKSCKTATQRDRARAVEYQLAAANFRAGYLAAENAMLKRMISLSIGAQHEKLNTSMLQDGLALLPRGKQ